MKTFDENYMNDENTDAGEGVAGTTSDYILIAMIVAMMFCMTICCLCLFCRSSSHCVVCGFNFEMTNQTTSIAIDDLSELHEVVPLTPTATGNDALPNIENILCSDPPPPKYSEEVASMSMRDRFRWKSRRKKNSSSRDKSDTSSRKSDSIVRGQSKRSSTGRTGRSSQSMFQRSISYQHPRITSLRSLCYYAGEERSPPARGSISFQLYLPSMPRYPRNHTSSVLLEVPRNRYGVHYIGDKTLSQSDSTKSLVSQKAASVSSETNKKVAEQSNELPPSSESYDDDEVFI
ncbi:LOW QUALITY PROTEIN: uncharacterized protein LOC100175365 [Ciona intestinalis]